MAHGLLEILKYFFLAVLWLFFIYAARMVLVDTKRSSSIDDSRSEPESRPDPREQHSPTRLRILAGDRKGEVVELRGELTLGRSNACDVSFGHDTYASSIHARIYEQGEDVILEDLGSTNGTYLNQELINGSSLLERGDRVQIGSTVLEVRR